MLWEEPVSKKLKPLLNMSTSLSMAIWNTWLDFWIHISCPSAAFSGSLIIEDFGLPFIRCSNWVIAISGDQFCLS
jgi:hypothetical protein